MKKRIWGFAATAAALAALVATPASAHRQWMMPSSTVLSGDDVWVTVDAAVSNDLFYFEHQPLRLDAMKAWAPDGSEAAIENKSTGRYRSTFDVHLTQKGTWRIASIVDGVMGSYDLNGKTEAVLPKREQTPRESYRPGERIVALLKDIDREARGPQIIMSRTDVGLLVKLFEMEVPEIFEGIVIGLHRGGLRSSFTVRKVSFGQGVERIFPLHSPTIAKVDVVRSARVRRAKLYFLRNLKGKAARMKETKRA